MKDWSYGKRVKALLGGSILFLVLYILYFTNTTWPVYCEASDLEMKVVKAASAPGNISRLQEQMSFMEQTIGTQFEDSASGREILLESVSAYCNTKNITLREFPVVSVQNESGMELETNVVIAEGRYHNLLDLLYYLEVEEKLGRPVSVSFAREYDRKIKKEVLTVTIYLQTINWN